MKTGPLMLVAFVLLAPIAGGSRLDSHSEQGVDGPAPLPSAHDEDKGAAAVRKRIDERVRATDAIVFGRVERYLEVDAERPRVTKVAVVSVEERLLGPGIGETVRVFEAHPHSAPRIGEPAVFWLGTVPPSDVLESLRVEGDRPVAVWQTLESWTPEAARSEVNLPLWLFVTLTPEQRRGSFEALRAELDASLARSFPSIEAEFVSLGRPWHLTLGPSRQIVERTAHQPATVTGVLTEEQWNALLSTLVTPAYLTLPDHVGVSPGPDSGLRVIEFRTTRVTHRLRIESASPEDPKDAAVWVRATAIWNALPGDHNPRMRRASGSDG